MLSGEFGRIGLEFLLLVLLHFGVIGVGGRFYSERDEVYNQNLGVDRPMW